MRPEEYLKIIFDNNLQEELLEVLEQMLAHYEKKITLDKCLFCEFNYRYSCIFYDRFRGLGCAACPYNLINTTCGSNAQTRNHSASELRESRPGYWRKKRIRQLKESIEIVNEYARNYQSNEEKE